MNYGYNKECNGWKEHNKLLLASELDRIIRRYKPDEKYRNYTPYIEVDGPWGGVRVRRITHIPNQDELIEEMDRVYDMVMGLK